MLNAKESVAAVGIAAAVALGAVANLRQPAAVAQKAAAHAPSAVLPAAPPPDKCTEACKAIPASCAEHNSVTCAIALQAREREGKVDCSKPMTRETLDALGWCPDGGEARPLFGGPR